MTRALRPGWWRCCWLLALSCAVGLITLSVPSPCVAQLERTPLEQQVDQAIVRALAFLASQQRPTGGWVIDQFDGEATSASSLAMMAFLAAGHVPGEGGYAANIDQGIEYLLSHQRPDGLLVHNTGHGPMYCHGVSSLFLAEVCGQLPEPRGAEVRRALERAIALILKSQAVDKQRRHAGGWRYSPESNDSDLSVTGWQLLALRAAKDIGCDVPAESIDLAVDYVKACQSRRDRGFCYQPGGDATPTLTGTGLLALQVCGATDLPEIEQGVDWLRARPLRPHSEWYYYGAYYCSISLYKQGGDVWAQQKPLLFVDLLSQQGADGAWHGTANEAALGPMYATSLAVLALSVEYGYLPIYQR